MIVDLRPYPEYKESGAPWVEQVPSHWTVRRMKSSMTNVVEQATRMEMDDVYVALENIESWTGRVKPQRGKYLFTGQVKRFQANDILFGKLRPYLAKVTRLQINGLCVGELFVLRSKDDSFLPEYLEYQLRTKPIIDWITSSTFGARMPRTDWVFVGNLSLLLPPPPEQVAIVQFLDWANGRLDKTIRGKQKMVKLLNKQKQTIIHQAVTRGLDPTVKFKSSGIPWLGEIPEHWVERPLKHWAQLNVHTLGETTNPLYTFQYIDIGTVEAGRLVRKPAQYQFANAPSRARRILMKGDVIVSTVRTYLRAIWFVDHEPTNLIASTGFTVLSPNSDVEPEYLSYIAQDTNFIDRVVANSVGIAYPAISESALSRLKIALPDSKEEQKRLVLHIKSQIQPYVAAISRLECEIDLLHEYRTRLIADVVTGKLDVREAAARLPAGAAEPVDEVLDIDEPEEVAEFDEREVET